MKRSFVRGFAVGFWFVFRIFELWSGRLIEKIWFYSVRSLVLVFFFDLVKFFFLVFFLGD